MDVKTGVFMLAVFLAFLGGAVLGVNRKLQKLAFLLLMVSTVVYIGDVQFGPKELLAHRGTIWGFRYTVTDLLNLMLLIGLFFRAGTGKARFRLFPAGSWAFLLMITAATISMISAHRPLASGFEVNNLLLGYLLFLTVANFVQTEEDLRFALGCLVTAMAVAAIVGFQQHFQYLIGRPYINRVWGTTRHPNMLAIYLNALLPLCLIWGFNMRRTMPRVLLVGLALLAAGTVIFTLSRAGAVAMGLALATAFFLYLAFGSGSGKVMQTAAFLLLLIPFCIKFVPLILSRLSPEGDAAVSSHFREDQVERAQQAWQSDPLTGIGMNNWTILYPGDAQIHNTYMLTLTETGLLGLMALILLLTWLFFRAVANLRKSPRDSLLRVASIGFAAAFVPIYIQFYVEFAIRDQNIHYLLHTLAGFLVSIYYLIRQRREAPAVAAPRPPAAQPPARLPAAPRARAHTLVRARAR